jgi:hypothetical protein
MSTMAVPDGAPDEVPALRHLMSAYFHQDFHAAYGGVWETLDVFASEAPAEFSRLPQEVAAVLHRGADEAQVGPSSWTSAASTSPTRDGRIPRVAGGDRQTRPGGLRVRPTWPGRG